MWNRRKWVYLPHTPGGWERTTCFLAVDGDTWYGKDVQLKTNHKVYELHFCEVWSKDCLKLDLIQLISVLEIQQKTRKKVNGLLSALFFSPGYVTYFCKLTRSSQFPYSLSAPDGYLRVNVVYKPLGSSTNVCVRQLLPQRDLNLLWYCNGTVSKLVKYTEYIIEWKQLIYAERK